MTPSPPQQKPCQSAVGTKLAFGDAFCKCLIVNDLRRGRVGLHKWLIINDLRLGTIIAGGILKYDYFFIVNLGYWCYLI